MPDRCPTCGSEVRVTGRTTKHYEPAVSREAVEREIESLRDQAALRLREADRSLNASMWRVTGRLMEEAADRLTRLLDDERSTE